jgi:diacylglycerol kinase family enzyme
VGRYPLIFNPRARSQKGQRALRFLMDHATRFAMHATNSAAEARELAAGFARQGAPVVVAAGGDGTLNAVVQGLAGSQTALGVLPAGIPFDNLPRALEVIEAGLVKEIDLFEANGIPFVQMAGVGFDAMVIEETTWESKKMLGPLAYLLTAVKVLGEEPPRMEVICDDGRREEGVAVLAGNGSLYGGQFKLFHKADNRDSMLDVLVFKEAGYKLVLDSLRGIAFGGVEAAGTTVAYLQARSCRVIVDREVPVQVDGELAGRWREVQFGNEDPGRLRVIAPEEPIGSRFAEALKSMVAWTKWKPVEQKA